MANQIHLLIFNEFDSMYEEINCQENVQIY